MSETLSGWDHIIFAMIPLGIVTAIVSLVRVKGPRIAKSFIGRARENRALAEIELMSSTSKEVCEVFNTSSVVRTMGSPNIVQLLIFPAELQRFKEQGEIDSETSCGIHTLETASKAKGPNDAPLLRLRGKR